MKKTLLLVLSCIICANVMAKKVNEKDVPAAVKEAFKNAYTNAEEVKWDKEDENYEASFEADEQDMSVLIDAHGKIIETEKEIELSELPEKVKKYVNAHYKGQVIKEAAIITDANGVLTYEAEIKNKDLLFDKEGNFLK